VRTKPRVSRHRYRVVLRPRARRVMWARRTAIAGMLMLAAMAIAVVHRIPSETLSFNGIKASVTPRIDEIQIDGVPDDIAQRLLAFLRSENGTIAQRARALRSRFDFLERVNTHHDWLAHRARFNVALRRPIAVAVRHGVAQGYLDVNGVVFSAPSDLYTLSSPVVDVTGAADGDNKALALCLADIMHSPDLPAPLDHMRFVSALDGWQADFRDGTQVSWGSLEWTSEKLSRLHQALLDARSRLAVGVLAADLRYFEDGKIILKPLTGVASSTRSING